MFRKSLAGDHWSNWFISLLCSSSFILIFLGGFLVPSSSELSALIRAICIELFCRVGGMASFLRYMIGSRIKGSA